MTQILVDTSFLLFIAKNNVQLNSLESIFGKIEFILLDTVLEELKHISFSKSIKKNSAKLALNFVKNFKIVKFDYVSDVDTSILIYSQKHSVNVATCDKKLRKQLKNLCIRVISPHQNQLIVD